MSANTWERCWKYVCLHILSKDTFWMEQGMFVVYLHCTVKHTIHCATCCTIIDGSSIP